MCGMSTSLSYHSLTLSFSLPFCLSQCRVPLSLSLLSKQFLYCSLSHSVSHSLSISRYSPRVQGDRQWCSLGSRGSAVDGDGPVRSTTGPSRGCCFLASIQPPPCLSPSLAGGGEAGERRFRRLGGSRAATRLVGGGFGVGRRGSGLP